MPGDPLFINASAGAPSYTAAELRRAFAALLSPKGVAGTNRFDAIEGIRVGSGVVTSLAGSTITVKAHAGVISPALSSTQGPYVFQLPADETHTLTAAHATLVRDDLVVMRIDDNDEDASGARQAISVYVAGTPGAGIPSLPARTWELARINVPQSGGGSAVLTERGLFTVASGGVLPVRDSSDRPAHYEGRAIYQQDTDLLLLSNGSAWAPVATAPAKTAAGSTRMHWGTASSSTDASGYATLTHGAGFTPTVVHVTALLTGGHAGVIGVDTIGATTFRVRLDTAGVIGPLTYMFTCLA